MRFTRLLLSLAAACVIGQSAIITTTFASNNGFSGAMFDLRNISSNLVNLTGRFEGNFDTGSGTVQVWYRVGTYSVVTTNPAAWTLLGSAQYTSTALNAPTPFDVGATLALTPGQTYGILVTVGDNDTFPLWYDAASVPEPATVSLMAAGFAGLVWLRRRKPAK